jgi:hypothetical protein
MVLLTVLEWHQGQASFSIAPLVIALTESLPLLAWPIVTPQALLSQLSAASWITQLVDLPRTLPSQPWRLIASL